MRIMYVRNRGQWLAGRIALASLVLFTAITSGQTPSPSFQLNGDPSELNGLANGAAVTPVIGPVGTLTVTGSGGPAFGPVGTANGVAFRQGGLQIDNTSYYKFSGQSIGN